MAIDSYHLYKVCRTSIFLLTSSSVLFTKYFLNNFQGIIGTKAFSRLFNYLCQIKLTTLSLNFNPSCQQKHVSTPLIHGEDLLKNTGRCAPDKGYGNGCIQVLHLMDKNSSKYVIYYSGVLGCTTLDILESPSRLIASNLAI